MIVTLKMHCEALLLLVAMTWAVAVGCVVYPSSAGALLAAGIAGLGMIFIVRRSIFDCVGFRLVDDERKLTTLRRRLARGYLLFGAPVIAVALAVVNGAT